MIAYNLLVQSHIKYEEQIMKLKQKIFDEPLKS